MSAQASTRPISRLFSPDSPACKDPDCEGRCRESFNTKLKGIAYFHRESGTLNTVNASKNYVCVLHEDCLRSHDLGRVCFAKSEFVGIIGTEGIPLSGNPVTGSVGSAKAGG